MKKNGFTLAEVLITLAIIGVVATMTLPALMTNTAEQQAKTALKKGINTLTEAIQMEQAIDGNDFSSLNVTAKEDNVASLYGVLARRTTVDFGRVGTAVDAARFPQEGNYAMFFRDGSAVLFPDDLVNDETTTELQDDGLPLGLSIVYDTNGLKGPNTLSNCNGTVSQADDGTADTSDIAACTRANRVIKDRFGVRLRGGYAVPNGAAARWAFEN